jgi:regulator of nucleoside diphosphate kinase
MTDIAPSPAPSRPSVHLSELEFDALNALALAISHSQPGVSELLLAELERAQVYPAGSLPEGTAAMNSRVTFRDARSGAVRTVQIVFPHQADISRDKVSVGTPVGACLIGLRAGDRIMCRYHDGQQRSLEILDVLTAPAG